MAGGESSENPAQIDTIAVSFEDLMSALEFNEQRAGAAVLRLTPPFHGRMRARLHVEQPNEYEQLSDPEPIHLDPQRLLDENTIPPYPHADRTRARLDDQSRSYTIDDHYTTHVEALEDWRTAVRGAVLDTTTITTQTASIDVRIVLLG